MIISEHYDYLLLWFLQIIIVINAIIFKHKTNSNITLC